MKDKWVILFKHKTAYKVWDFPSSSQFILSDISVVSREGIFYETTKKVLKKSAK